MRKKLVWGGLTAIIICGIFALTFQSSEGTMMLSESTRKLLATMGLKMSGQSLRSNVHIIMYLLLGAALVLFGRSVRWKPWMTILIGCAIGLMDESVKVFLPGREFDIIDLMKDYLGIGIANLIWLIRRVPNSSEE